MGSRQNVILILILLIAGLARFLGQNMSPPSLYWEETALGYDAYSLLKTGKDHHGNPWPIVAFESFGDWKPSGYYYALLPSLRIFGLTDLAVRLPSMVAGILTVYLIYLITLEATSKKDLALWSAAALAISPWHIHFSRAAFEVNLATFWLTLGIFGLIKGKKNAMYLGLSAFSWAASIYTYHGLRVLAPLMIVSLLWIWKKELRKQKWLGLCLLTGVLLVWPIISAWNTPQIQQRINETSLFSTSQAVITQNQWRQDDRWSIISRIVHHRYWLWAEEMIKGGLNHLKPNFWLFSGDNNPRHQSGFRGLIYLWWVVPLFLGWRRLFSENKLGFVGVWFILATIPPALTNLTPHSLRFLPAAPALAIIIGLGLEHLGQMKVVRKNLMRLIILSLCFGSLSVYLMDLIYTYPSRSSQEWQYGYRQVMEIIQPAYHEGKSIYLTNHYGRAMMYAMFYLKIEPEMVQKFSSDTKKDQGELLELGQLTTLPEKMTQSQIIVSEKSLQGLSLIALVNFLDGQPGFYIYEN